MEDLPQQCNYLALGAARIREIKAIVSRLDECGHGKRVSQKLPRHMQRRAVSSNPRRLPRYLREKHMREGGNKVKPSSRPSRKYRRRPSNLLKEYNRRSKKNVWLETHIWHAKRFHMQKHWGYTLPDSPTCRGHRASQRAATVGCLLQDVSYLCCIELEGAKSSVTSGLSRSMLPESFATLTHPQVLAGRQWMTFMFFQPGRQPYGALTEVDLLFHPSHNTEIQEEKIKLWLWVHPSSYSQVVDSLVEIFQLENDLPSSSDWEKLWSQENTGLQDNLVNTEGNPEAEEIIECKETMHEADEFVSKKESVPGKENEAGETVKPKQKKKKKTIDVNAEKLRVRNIPFERTPKYSSGDKRINMVLLKDTLNRYKLTGPKSYKVLSSAFLPATVAVEETEVKMDSDEETGRWWQQYFGEAQNLLSHQKQVAVWKQLASLPHPSYLAVLPLTVRDPRVTLPAKKVQMEVESSGSTKQDDILEWPSESPLYRSDLRDQVTVSKDPDSVLNKCRGEFLVPGVHMPETPQEARLPLVLLSRPPSSAGQGGGWEVVVPAGWGMSVFLPLVFHGGVVGGQHEAENFHLEALTSFPSHLLPDTPAGGMYSTWLASERHKEFFKKPPNSRINHIKLGVQFPFIQPWQKLVQEWQPGVSDFFVLRNSRLIACLSSLMENINKNRYEMKEKAPGDSNTENNGKLTKTTAYPLSFNRNTFISTEGVYNGKRKADDDLNVGQIKRAKQANMKEETQQEKVNENGGVETCQVCTHEADAMQELETLSPVCLVMVQLVLSHKGTLEPCSMVCLPKEEDLMQDNDLLKPHELGNALEEPLHSDHNHDLRAKRKEEQRKIQTKISQARRKARQRVLKKMDIASATHNNQSVEEAMSEALEMVRKENEVIIHKVLSYKEERESLWMISATEPLQRCARLIMGYTTHGAYSNTHARGSGIGWVGLKPLLSLIQLCMTNLSQKSRFWEGPSRQKAAKCLPVLVRNPTSLQYRWAMLSVVKGPYLHVPE